MKTEIMIAVLALLCIGSLAAAFVLWAKLDEQKKLTQEEREKRWDEISRSASLENEIERLKESYFVDTGFCDILEQERAELQDRLSALLCPLNDHVWKDGVCVKCGRVKDAEIH